MDHMVLLVAVSAFFSTSDYLIGLNLMNLKLARAINVTQNVLGYFTSEVYSETLSQVFRSYSNGYVELQYLKYLSCMPLRFRHYFKLENLWPHHISVVHQFKTQLGITLNKVFV